MDSSCDARVFGVGMNKTGTSSLRRCLKQLGVGPIASGPTYSSEVMAATRALFDAGDYEPALKFAARYRAFEDRPWNVWEMYRRLDERFPGSLFILTVRDVESWWRSVDRWIHVTKPEVAGRYRQHLGASDQSREQMVAGYLRYNQAVQEYFASSDRLLVVDFESGDGWEQICSFLGLEVPSLPFPQANPQSYDAQDLKREELKSRKRRQRRRQGGKDSVAAPKRWAYWLMDSRLVARARLAKHHWAGRLRKRSK